MKKRQRTLKEKIFGYMLGFCVLLLGILWFFQTFLLTDMYRSIRTNELYEAIATIEKEINNPNLGAIIEDVENKFDIKVMKTGDFMLSPPIFPSVGHQISHPMQTITEHHDFVLENGEKLSLTFYALVVPVSATTRTLHNQLKIITIIMILSAIILANTLAKRIARPIEEVAENAKTLVTGNYEAVFKGTEYFEIVELSKTLNQTAKELKKVERRL